jgi:hypothetical protein
MPTYQKKLDFKIPIYVKAKEGSIILPDLNLIITDKDKRNLFKEVGENKIYRSKLLKQAIETGLLVDASSELEELVDTKKHLKN